MTMTFATLRAANLSRCARWHPRGLKEWSLSDWGVATAGEMGEALNVIKKLNRERDSIAGNTLTEDQLWSELADEIADVAIYLDIMAASENIDLAAAIARKFNKTSAKVGFPERLPEGVRCEHCGADDSAASSHCAPPFDVQPHAFTGNHPADRFHPSPDPLLVARAEMWTDELARRASCDSGSDPTGEAGTAECAASQSGTRDSAGIAQPGPVL